MAASEHRYQVHVSWSGETRSYQSYSRAHRIAINGKPTIAASADPAFLGDADLPNPEDMLLAALSACHMLWYLHLCAVNGVVVTAYEDRAEATMVEAPCDGRFTDVVLHPVVTITADSDADLARSLHERAHAECFIANSVNFPVRHVPVIKRAG
ncbi:OsmC family protein [Dichotomicrobium thermohalophilum]|uniref:Organic hydroperoxide reductase OsmC/OhrA n=1 Tax=Dichotomicrobium thermohalophilum TaxID=933063 RepID=A0A397QCD2_9HYPH|nr:OsmC family protein [Dichotomicrobium thermohalophilum]RIA55911.1 organic hydroperoxide reductase OsmC/OhrA [Dichotomicrobium thermohalophilum]